ncbi:MAG: Stk1 family PASTA domain-containing Ser/Thr kinase [Clostridia bacterium]|jgi:serine/threonine-protein kinase|nr:Stk1 family PASTA domain-containing Ser/Thr kinase [Clostridia bacterium]
MDTGKIFHDRYEILEKIGSGGTSLVYKARDVLLNRLVTIKILREQFASDEAFVRRFRNEAQAVACLSHPNIVSIYDVVFTEDSHYLVMEYVEGCSLKEYIEKNGRLAVVLATDIASQILDALQHAHDHNVIHRDIKPHNILLDQNMQVKVTDFGIAVALTDITQTYTGDVMGSVHYMSPEQVQGSSANERSDIYSAGVVLYEMLTGKQPFLGDNAIGVAMQHIQGEVMPPHKLNPEVPLELSFIVMRAMRKNPQLRYAKAKDMRDNLKKLDFQKASSGQNNTKYKNDDFNTVQKNETTNNADENPKGRKAKSVLLSKFKDKNKLSSTSWIIISVAALVLISAIIFISIIKSFVGANEDVVVPSVVGSDVLLAQQTLTDLNLQAALEYRSDDEVEENLIISQDIPAGQTVKEGRIITLYVSEGPAKKVVPDVLGLTLKEATLMINNRMLTVTTREVLDDTASPGTIVAQRPTAGSEVLPNSNVEVDISKGKEITMPNLLGLTLEQARAKLAENNLEIGKVSREESTSYAADLVIAQSTAAKSKIFEGNTIDLTLSDGPGTVASTARVSYTLPVTEEQYTVKIVVIDTKGSHEEYNATHNGGDSIVEDVPFYGKGTIQILLDDDVVYSKNVP